MHNICVAINPLIEMLSIPQIYHEVILCELAAIHD